MILWSNYSIVAGVRNKVHEGNNGENKHLFLERAGGGTMGALRVTRKSLQRRYREDTRTLLRLAKRLPERPVPDDIHDLRVAVRRIQVIRGLLPKTVRDSQASKSFELVLKSTLRSTSELRDIDTLTDTLRSHKANLPPQLLVSLENRRSDAAARARAESSVIAETPAPDLDLSGIKGKRLSSRLRKRAKKRNAIASRLLNGVLDDESKVEELHALRKEVKKLRYLLELANGGSNKLSMLTKWQDSLGAIHDFDVAMSYLEKSHFETKPKAIDELRMARHTNYLKFVRDYRTALTEPLGEKPPITGSSDPGITAA